MMPNLRPMALAVAALGIAGPAGAEVIDASATGFVSQHRLVIAAPPDKVWAAVVRPQWWWSKDHSYSGDAANLSLDPRPGGCWCERLPGGGVEHGRVVFADPGKLLRVVGAFGPLQSGAVTATLTFALRPEGKGTALTISYIVAGYHPGGLASFARPVDGVFAAQLPALKQAAER
jgi:uncharacterized protein YndB with AHSA1/START domain